MRSVSCPTCWVTTSCGLAPSPSLGAPSREPKVAVAEGPQCQDLQSVRRPLTTARVWREFPCVAVTRADTCKGPQCTVAVLACLPCLTTLQLQVAPMRCLWLPVAHQHRHPRQAAALVRRRTRHWTWTGTWTGPPPHPSTPPGVATSNAQWSYTGSSAGQGGSPSTCTLGRARHLGALACLVPPGLTPLVVDQTRRFQASRAPAQRFHPDHRRLDLRLRCWPMLT
mmetsp:Transcript_19320/g.61471  ORF Transcript_19320/g.61471 Transcript_19320/m.61471 type:complete len:225 (+) Transcript_19320:885-1559(+)